jgi:hypothetical protein
LEAGEVVIVRIDVRIACDPGSGPTGNLQAKLEAARVVQADGAPVNPPDAIPGGAQTIPFKKVGELSGVNEPLLVIDKTVATVGGICGIDDIEELPINQGDTVKYCYVLQNPGTATLFDVSLNDDNGTPGDPSDDFVVSLNGLADLDGEADLGDLAAGGTAFGEALVTITTVGAVVNTGTATGSNGLSGGNLEVLTQTDTATVYAAPRPTSVDLLTLGAKALGNGILVTWETVSEVDNLGFHLYRSESADGPRIRLNQDLIPSQLPPGSADGAAYQRVDSAVERGITYYYWLEAIDVYGVATLHGPADAELPLISKTFVRLSRPRPLPWTATTIPSPQP